MVSRSQQPKGNTTQKLPSTKRSNKPAFGPDYDIKQIEARDRFLTSRMRDRLALLILAAIGIALLIAVFGKWPDFSGVEHVWSVAGPFVGSIATYYFQRGRKDTG